MRKAAFSFIVLALAALATSAGAHPPVIVELFTAQGCSSCGEANGRVAELAGEDDVLPLTFSVDYWDYLGWTDTFAKPEYAERQRAYARRLGPREVYTPQVVVDGRKQASGAKEDGLEDLITEGRRAPRNPPDMLFQLNGKIAVGSGPRPRGGADVWLVRYDPAEVEVEVKARNVVRQLVRLGTWRGRPNAWRLPPAEQEGLETLVIVQQAGGGRIIAALRKEP